MITHKVDNSHTVGGAKYILHSEDGVHMVKVVNIWNLLDCLYPHGHFGVDGYGERHSVKKWCDKNDSHYYEHPREDFSITRAVREAIVEGKSCVVVEDLS